MTPEKKSSQNSNAETLGRRFLAAREEKGLSQTDAATATRMMEKHIRAIEANDFAALGASVYARGFVKLYSDYLGLDTAAILAEFGKRPAKRSDAPILAKPQPHSERKAEITEAVQERVEKVVSVAKQLPARVSGNAAKKVFINSAIGLLLVMVIVVCVFIIKGCASSLKEKQPVPHRSTHRSDAVIEEPADPYLDTP